MPLYVNILYMFPSFFKQSLKYTHTHTHTHTYIYIYIIVTKINIQITNPKMAYINDLSL